MLKAKGRDGSKRNNEIEKTRASEAGTHFFLLGLPRFFGGGISLALARFWAFGLRPLFLGGVLGSSFFVNRPRAPVPCAARRIFALVSADGRLSLDGALEVVLDA